MAYTRPDVYIEEILTPEIAPNGISTSIAAFLGFAERGPANTPIFIDSFASFKATFGNAVDKESLYYSVRSFFENGGSACYIVRLIDVSACEGAGATVFPAFFNFENDTGDFLKFEGGFRGKPSFGTWASQLGVRISLSEALINAALLADVAAGDESLQLNTTSGVIVGDIIKVLDANSVEHFFKVTKVRSDSATGTLKKYVDVSSPAGAAITAAGSAVIVLAYDISVVHNGEVLETFTRTTMNPDSDRYIETIINDEQVGSKYVRVDDLGVGTLVSNQRELKSTQVGNLFALVEGGGQDEKSAFEIKADLTDVALPKLSAKKAVNLLCVPPSLDSVNGKLPAANLPLLHANMLEFCGNRMDMFAILDAPSGLLASKDASGSIGAYRSADLGLESYWGALYYPSIKVPKVIGGSETIVTPPSGAIAGLYSRVDQISAPRGGISTSPAGHDEFGQLKGLSGVEVEISDSVHGDLNQMGINCLRIVDRANGLPSVNVLGARTLSSNLDFRYINVRRMMTFIEKSVKSIGERSLFRNNGPTLWSELTLQIESFLSSRAALGELAGASSDESFYIKIDNETNTADNIRQGILVAEIGVALLRPAEFIIFRFSQIQSN